jgi:hypothetical protein
MATTTFGMKRNEEITGTARVYRVLADCNVVGWWVNAVGQPIRFSEIRASVRGILQIQASRCDYISMDDLDERSDYLSCYARLKFWLSWNVSILKMMNGNQDKVGVRTRYCCF